MFASKGLVSMNKLKKKKKKPKTFSSLAQLPSVFRAGLSANVQSVYRSSLSVVLNRCDRDNVRMKHFLIID